ncbi:MAG: hypothetical protein RL333_873 [Pseudomonadota bacterium]
MELVEVSLSEMAVLADYSWPLWQAAYEPGILATDLSRLLWRRSYSKTALEAAFASGEKTFWVRMAENRIGFVAYRLEAVSRQMRLSKLYLHPDYWGLGLGCRVLQRVSEVAIEAGATCIDLYVFRRNLRAIQAYQRAGFRVAREELTDLGDGVIYDDLVMIKTLE